MGKRFLQGRGIDFTRSRPYRKNGSPYVESKNWSMMRAYTGWRRYDTDEGLEALDSLLRLVAMRQFVHATDEARYEKREGGKVFKTTIWIRH